MTTTYDPKHPLYLDEADVRGELTRVFDLCHQCGKCVDLCTTFPTLFGAVDRHPEAGAGQLTPAQQDQVVDECFQCKLCAVNCPYTPGRHEWAIDFPRLMLRTVAMRHATGQRSVRAKVTAQVMGRTDLVGRLGSMLAPTVNALVGAKKGALARKVLRFTAGVSAVRLLPTYSKVRFSSWFAKRPRLRIGKRQGRVTVYPTCIVEFQEPQIGHDLVKVYERNGIECTLSDARCCGAPWLHAGDIERFTKVAARNVGILAAEVRKGTDIIVPQPTCSYVVRNHYLDYVGGADAELVAEHTFDAAEYLMNVHRAEGTRLDTAFEGDVPETITYHTPGHLLAQDIGVKARDLMKLTGASVKLVQQCSGIDVNWDLRASNDDTSLLIAARLGDEIKAAGGDVVTSDCHLANTVITEQTGRVPLHPLQLIARAYGIHEE